LFGFLFHGSSEKTREKQKQVATQSVAEFACSIAAARGEHMAALPNAEPLATNELFLVVSDHSSFARNDRLLWFVERLLAATSLEVAEVRLRSIIIIPLT
jgi:hypothetical protein